MVGADFALFSMACVIFVTKYRKLHRRHELIAAILWGLLALSMLVVWILRLSGVI